MVNETEIRCSNCNDLIDTSFNLKKCQRCGNPLENYQKKKVIENAKVPLPKVVAVIYSLLGSFLIFLIMIAIFVSLQGFIPKGYEQWLGVVCFSFFILAAKYLMDYLMNKKY